eukprot:gene828-1035_t
MIKYLLAFLLCIAYVSATFPYPCGPYNCNYGEICHTLDGQCKCIKINDCHDVDLTFNKIGQWQDGSRDGKTFTQYDVTIHNNLDKNIKQIYIGYDSSLKLRDNNAIWNVERYYGYLTLPSYQPSVNAHASYTFGFIIEGTVRPNLYIVAVTF